MNFKHVFIITYGRTGSTLLQGLLNSVDGVVVRGENFNFCYGLFKSYQALKKVVQEKVKEGKSPTSPFYGSNFFDELLFKDDMKKLLKKQLGIDSESNVKCWGFKEIRYTPEGLNEKWGYSLKSYLDFINEVFDSSAFIFLTRNHDDVLDSAFWKNKKKDRALENIIAFEKESLDWSSRFSNTYWIDYKDIVSVGGKLEGLYRFLGFKYIESDIIDTLKIEHSYANKKENILSAAGRDKDINSGAVALLKDKSLDSTEIHKKENNKSSPFIIWTLRRSGGTNLGEALFKSSVYSGVQHEPFNPDRVFGYVTKEWMSNKDLDSLYKSIDSILAKKPLIKHCFEIVPEVINTALIELSIKHGYNHLFLYREYPTDRLLSLNYALKTGIWGKEQKNKKTLQEDVFNSPVDVDSLIKHEKNSRKAIRNIYNSLVEKGVEPVLLTFESLYTGAYEYSKSLVISTFKALSINDGVLGNDVLKKMLRGGGQGTKDKYLKFPGSEKLVQESKRMERLTLKKTPLLSFNKSEYAKQLNLFEIWRLDLGVKSDLVYFSGVVFDKDLKNFKIYIILKNGNRVDFEMGLPSPRIEKKFNQEGLSGNSRFLSQPFNASSGVLYLESERGVNSLGDFEIKEVTSP